MLDADNGKLPKRYWTQKAACDLEKRVQIVTTFDQPLMMGYKMV